jgi:hypothetical protein
MLSLYQGPMSAFLRQRPLILRSLTVAALLALGSGLSGCASVGDAISPAFADPAKFDLFECKQLGPTRESLAAQIKDLERLMAKAETGVGGTVVAEMVYRNEYISVRGQQKLADEAWRRNKCQASKLEAAPAAVAPAEPLAPPPIGGGPRLPGCPVY